MTQVIIFNAPPEAGKDIAVKEILKKLDYESPYHPKHVEFKSQIYKQVELFYNLSEERMFDLYFSKDSRKIKELPNSSLNGRSPREALIHMSEVITKPNFGEDYYGKSAAVKCDGDVVLISDGGFPIEIGPIVDKVGFENVCIIRIQRDGADFSKDSRDYFPDGLCATYYDIKNKMPFGKDNEKEYREFLELVTQLTFKHLGIKE